MKGGVLREHGGEALVGLLVVLFAAWFTWFVWGRTNGNAGPNATRVEAFFPNASGVNIGTDVRVAGIKVGTVAAQTLDPESFQVKTTLAIDPTVKLPSDSSAAITSEGLLGSTYIALLPGGATTPLKSGDVIFDTQGAIDMMGMIGQFINRTGEQPAAGTMDDAAPPAP